MSVFCRLLVVSGCLLFGLIGSPVYGQNIDVGGRAFVDYFYQASSPDEQVEGLHGFQYRRLYLTTDFSLSNDLDGRARLEANDQTTGPKGPVPFVKDLYLRWHYWGRHSATLGVTKPPAFEISTEEWGYRSLEKTILDLQGVVDSRDFGLRLDGPLVRSGDVRYSLMYANNDGVRPETDNYKRVYGRISATPTYRLTVTAGADYTESGDRVDHNARVSGFVGYTGRRTRFGLEAYGSRVVRSDTSDVDKFGASIYGVIQVARRWELIGRFDWNIDLIPGQDPIESLILTGVAYRPHPNVAFIPNLRAVNSDRFVDTDLQPRLTMDLSF